jgi:hypothetical protein
MKKFFKDTFNKGNFNDYFTRNKIFLIVSAILVILSLFTGFNKGISYTPVNNIILYQLSSMHISQNIALSPLSFFITDIFCVLYTICYGLSFSILSLFNILYYATTIGCLIKGNFTLIHVFESVILIFTFCASLLVTKMEVRIISLLLSGKTGEIKNKMRVPFKDLLMSLVIIIILLVITTIIYIII